MKRGKFYFFSVLVVLFATVYVVGTTPTASHAVTEISFWHAMSGRRLPAVERIVNGFNAAHPNIKVKAQFTGKYKEVIAKTIAAVKAGKPPHIAQVYEVGLQTMLDSGVILPIHELFKPGEVDFGDVVGPIRDYYSVKGKLYSMPFNSSTAILYYNKDLFRKAGLNPNEPPTTYKGLEKIGKKLVSSGVVPNALSTGWPAWIIEQAHAYHNIYYADNQNGRKGWATKVSVNQKFGVKYVKTMSRFAKDKVYIYGGREYSANKAFLAQQIAMLIQSTSSVGSIEKAAKGRFEVGTSFLPRFEGYSRGNSVIGGATLWVLKGHSKEDYDGIKEFLKWIIRPEVTMQWHKDTGYFPVTNGALKKLLDEGWFSEHPNHLTAFLQILSGVRTPESQGVKLGNFVEIRNIVQTALEKSFSGAASPEAALDEATKEANRVLREYKELY
ncbi:MAG: extracellular solute-binding protein [Candidatus Binatia bacterium]